MHNIIEITVPTQSKTIKYPSRIKRGSTIVNEEADNESDILTYFSKAQKSIVRDRIIAGEKRIDGRDSSTVRANDKHHMKD